MVAGVDEEGPHLFYSEPSGLYFPVQAHAIGSGAEGASTNLKEGFSEDMSLKDAENLAISALKQVRFNLFIVGKKLNVVWFVAYGRKAE